MVLGGVPEQALAKAGGLVDRAVAGALRMMDRLAEGDLRTWLAFLAVALLAVLLVGLWTGSITIRKGGGK